MRGTRAFKGTALVLVLWLVAALSLVVLASAHGIRQKTQSVALDMERLRAESVLDAAVQLTAQRMLAEKNEASKFRLQRIQLGPNDVWVETTPANGLIDVTVASDPLLQALFSKAGGVSPGEAAILASRVRDFIDSDDIPSGVGGAEAAQYRAAGWPVMPRNAALEDPSDLRSVLGITPQLYEIIAPYLGTNGKQRIEIGSAPPALIDALTGQPGFGVRLHASPPEMQAGVLLSEVGAALFSSTPSAKERTVRVRAFVQQGAERWWQREAWIDLNGRPDTLTPWTTLTLEPTRRVNKPDQEFRP